MAPEPIAIHLKDVTGVSRKLESVQLGIPLPKGIFESHSSFRLSDPKSGETVTVQTRPLAHWPDGSVRWLKVNFLASLAASQQCRLHLTVMPKEASQPPVSSLQFDLRDNVMHIHTGGATFRVVMNKLDWSAQTTGGADLEHTIKLTDAKGNECAAQLDSHWQVIETGPVCLTLATTGRWQTPDKSRFANFDCRLHFYANSDTVKLEVSIHNPDRARHPGGLWDLGDAGSAHFRSLSVHVSHPTSEQTWLKPDSGADTLSETADKRLYLYQDSSGGENWQSRNHVNAEGKVTTRFRGYQVLNGTKTLASGNRAQPTTGLRGRSGQVQASIHQFWQNFPSSLGTKSRELIIGLFPDDASEPYELQGGERKLQTVWLNYSEDSEALAWTASPVVPTLDAAQYEQSSAFPWFRADQPKGPLDDLINRGLDDPNNFFAKREVIDEYGWRNYGDLFADHETLYQDAGEAPFISHYNNQYDAIYGFVRQFALTGDPRLFNLMDDLAHHVADIDIYHTTEDRGEYNNGLFWHTDHYLDAHTATHRTYSRHNNTSSIPGQTGGGPGAEHCYSTGLLYHYYITGNEHSKAAVLDLAHWITKLHEGQNGFFEQLLALKKTELPQLKAMMTGKRPSTHTYPFTRGTGNYINTLLDAYLLENNTDWLFHAERVIRATIHPADDFSQRDLLDVENRWSYLVLLTSISRYLLVKRQLQAFDADYWYTVDSFVNYMDWMIGHENLFLKNPDQLEFPNDTWTAQDIRKAMLMFQAASLPCAKPEAYMKQGIIWMNQVCTQLETSPEATYTRILVILMQNYGPHQYLTETNDDIANMVRPTNLDKTPPTLTWHTLSKRIIKRIIHGLRRLNIKREKNWLNARMDRS